MNHCLLPLNPVRRHLKVPFLCSELKYSPPFGDYPERCGWTEDELSQGSGPGRSDLDALLQSWLFFGLIEESLGPLSYVYRAPASFLLFVERDPEDEHIIDTAVLWHDFYNLRRALENLDITGSQALKQAVVQFLKLAFLTCKKQLNQLRRNSFSPGSNDASDVQTVQSPVVLSILSLCVYLSLFFDIYDDVKSSLFEYLDQGLLEHQMLQDGWCPSQVTRLSRSLLWPSLYLVSNMQCPDPHKNHRLEDTQRNRQRCTEFQCFADHVHLDTYVTHHAKDFCGELVACEQQPFLAADQTLMFGLLKKQLLPLSIYDEKTHTLQIVASDEYPRYVAISHVWAHGLGNPYHNALPKCQLQRLSRIVNHLYPRSDRPVPFWVDTISCPTSPAEATSLAIIEMRNTYRLADKVVVLDTYFNLPSHLLTPNEMLLRILCSAWTTRLWTLQEGALAKDLYFCFSDLPVSIADLQRRLRDDPRLIAPDIERMLEELALRWFADRPQETGQLLVVLARAVRHRATSVAEDEALCLGTLAGIDMETLADVKVLPGQRMQKFWSIFEAPPSMLVFWEGGNLDASGYRWAPKSLLGQASTTIPGMNRSGFFESMSKEQTRLVDGRGLIFQSPGLLLGLWTGRIEDRFWVRHGGAWLLISCSSEKGFALREAGTLALASGTGDAAGRRDDSEKSLAIITQNLMLPETEEAFDEAATTLGVLAVVTRPDNGALSATPLMDVFVVSATAIAILASEERQRLVDLAEQLDALTRPGIERGMVRWEDPFTEEGLVEWKNVQGGEWHEVDFASGGQGDRWNYVCDGIHGIFQSLPIGPDQTWCLS
jgi:hypothetical protein